MEVLTALYKVADQDTGWRDEHGNSKASEGGTAVTMTEGYSLPEWPYKPQPW